jgi:hypothetical protein
VGILLSLSLPGTLGFFTLPHATNADAASSAAATISKIFEFFMIKELL